MATFPRRISEMQHQYLDCTPSEIVTTLTKIPTTTSPLRKQQSFSLGPIPSRCMFRSVALVHDVEIMDGGDLGSPTPGVPAAASLPASTPPTIDHSDEFADNSGSDNDDDDNNDDDFVLHGPSSRARTTSGHSFSRIGKRPAKKKTPKAKSKAPRRKQFLDDALDTCNDKAMVQYIQDSMDVNAYEEAVEWAFCCARCNCPQSVKEIFAKHGLEVGSNERFMQSAHYGRKQFHRSCCHRHRLGSRWVSPLDKARLKAIMGKTKNSRKCKVVNIKRIIERSTAEDRKVTELQNDSSTAGMFF